MYEMAALERLSVQGFKSIRALEEFELRRVNVLIGANGAGKSNFLDVFRMLSQLAHGKVSGLCKAGGWTGFPAVWGAQEDSEP